MGNCYQFGWDSLCVYSGLSKSTLIRKKEELIKAHVVDYPLKGRPPKRLMRWHPDRYDEFRDKGK